MAAAVLVVVVVDEWVGQPAKGGAVGCGWVHGTAGSCAGSTPGLCRPSPVTVWQRLYRARTYVLLATCTVMSACDAPFHAGVSLRSWVSCLTSSGGCNDGRPCSFHVRQPPT